MQKRRSRGDPQAGIENAGLSHEFSMSAYRAGDSRASSEAFTESERRYQVLAEALPTIVWTAGADGTANYFNTRWFDYTGMTFERAHGAGWQAVVHPNDLANSLDAWTRSLKNGMPYEVEYRLRRVSDGAYRWHVGRAIAIRDAAGAVLQWFGTCTDINDQKVASQTAGQLKEQLRLNATLEQTISVQKRAEAALRASSELFRQVEEQSPIGIALVALDGNFIRVNPALCALTGYSKFELLEFSYRKLLSPEDFDAAGAYVDETLKGGLEQPELEARYVHRDQHLVWCLMAASLVQDQDGEPLYLILQIQDISARKLADKAVQEAQTALASAAAKSRFLATMSHEIRTPMNAIIGMMELLSLSPLNAEQSECVRVVRDSSQSLLRVLNDILDFSKIEAGKLNLERADFDLPSQIASLVSLFDPQFQNKGVVLSTHVDSDIPENVKGDPGRLRQILTNLIGNALKFTPAPGTVGVLVTTESRSGGALTLRFTIADTGIGIPTDERDRLFMPFSQIDDSTTRKHGGTGLGLAICKQLVDLMGGRIGVASGVPSGSSFWFTVPMLEGNVIEHLSDAPAGETDELGSTASPRPEKLLLAEDNEINALLAVKQFKRLGFNVTVVPDGQEAAKAVRSQHFDIVFMDCHMPVLDGLDATRLIRQQASASETRVPIVAMTANAQAEDRRECIASGMDDYISKPASLSALRTVLTRWLPNANHDSSAMAGQAISESAGVG